jgi:hypothetical protein
MGVSITVIRHGDDDSDANCSLRNELFVDQNILDTVSLTYVDRCCSNTTVILVVILLVLLVLLVILLGLLLLVLLP